MTDQSVSSICVNLILQLMKACAAQGSVDLQFVEQMEKHTTHRVMLKHKEFELIILEIVFLITSLTSMVI